MAVLYIALKIGALLVFILAPLMGAKKKRNEPLSGLSIIAVTPDGELKHLAGNHTRRHSVR